MTLNASIDIGRILDLAYPYSFLKDMGVDFVRDEKGLPKVKRGEVWTRVTLKGLDYGGERDIKISRHAGPLEQAAKKLAGAWYISGGEISDRMSAAIRELGEPPPLYVP